ncbi:hypothetical protein B566_EDAN014562 [Ephemera danica]|nr:hypothetical protein B566_EDAN014562 [Ephemera danica]
MHDPEMSYLSKILEKWRSYRFRFVPWIVLNLNKRVKESSTRVVASQDIDSLIPPEKIEHAVKNFVQKLKKFDADGAASLSERNKKIMLEHLGFVVDRKPSQILGGGIGVFVTLGTAKKGDIVALYPGTIYQPYEPIFFPSLNNPFVFRCLDGTHIDGKDCGLSRIIYKSVAGRDRMGSTEVADLTWLGQFPINPWSIGQYVNNSTRELPCNVAYQECELQGDFPSSLLSLLPCALYNPGTRRRLVALVATSDIATNTEVLSSYYTLVGEKSAET